MTKTLNAVIGLTLFATLAACHPYTLARIAYVPPADGMEALPDPAQQEVLACYRRVNLLNKQYQKSKNVSRNWKIALGVIGGASSGFGIISATKDLTDKFGSAPAIVSASVAAATAILAPLVTSAEQVEKQASEFNVLNEQLNSAQEMLGQKDKEMARLQLLKDCAYKHIDFSVPPQLFSEQPAANP